MVKYEERCGRRGEEMSGRASTGTTIRKSARTVFLKVVINIQTGDDVIAVKYQLHRISLWF